MTTIPLAVELPLIQDLGPCGSLSINPYRACDIRCAYCITGAQGPSVPRFARAEVAERLHAELAEVGHLHDRLTVGTLCDAYPSVEAELGVTRAVLEALTTVDRTVSIVTKGLTIERDADLLARDGWRATISLTALDDAVVARLEPHAPSSLDRLALVHRLHDAGITVAVSVTPWIPDATDAEALIERVDPAIPVTIGPLNVRMPEVARTGFGQRFRQAEINDAYLDAWRRSTPRPNVTWLVPIPDDGHADQDACHPFTALGAS